MRPVQALGVGLLVAAPVLGEVQAAGPVRLLSHQAQYVMALDRSEAALWLGAIVVSAAAAFTFMTLPAPVVARDPRTGPTEAAPALP